MAPTHTLTHTHTHTLSPSLSLSSFLLLPAGPTSRHNVQLLGPAGPPLPGRCLPPSFEKGTAHRVPSTSAPAPAEFVCRVVGPLGCPPGSLRFGWSQEWLGQSSGDLFVSKS